MKRIIATALITLGATGMAQAQNPGAILGSVTGSLGGLTSSLPAVGGLPATGGLLAPVAGITTPLISTGAALAGSLTPALSGVSVLPSLPVVGGLPGLPAVAGLPVLGAMPDVGGLINTATGLAGGLTTTLPSLDIAPSMPALPGVGTLPALGGVVNTATGIVGGVTSGGLPAVPAIPALPVLPGLPL